MKNVVVYALKRSEEDFKELIVYLEEKGWKHTIKDSDLWEEENNF